MSKRIAIIVGIILLVVLLLFSMTYTVRFNQVAIKTRFGRTSADSIERDPGLKFRLPLFVDKVTTIDTRLQLRESPLTTVQTSDGQQVAVQGFLLWKVQTADDGPLVFSQRYSSVEIANNEISDQFNTALTSGLSRFAFNDLVGPQSRLQAAEDAILKQMMALQTNGIEPVSVGFSQLVLPARTTQAVLSRMNTTRMVISENERSKGRSDATGIENRARGEADKIRAFATLLAGEIRSAGERDAAKLMAQMSQAEDLAIFLTWIETLRNTLREQTTLVIPTAWAPFHAMNLETPLDENSIPQPSGAPATMPAIEPVAGSGEQPRSSTSGAPPVAPTDAQQPGNAEERGDG